MRVSLCYALLSEAGARPNNEDAAYAGPRLLALADPHGSAQELVRRALRNGSHPDVTCVVADVVEGDGGYVTARRAGAPGAHASLVRA